MLNASRKTLLEDIMRNEIAIVGTLAAALSLSCKPITQARVQGIEFTQKGSNIGVTPKGKLKSFRLTSNLDTPKALLAHLELSEAAINTMEDLYGAVSSVNKTEKLFGLEGPKQEITFVGIMGRCLAQNADDPRCPSEKLARFEQNIRRIHRYPANGPIPFLQTLLMPQSNFGMWLQDYAEFALFRDETGKTFHGVIDLNYTQEKDKEPFRQLIDRLGIPTLQADNYDPELLKEGISASGDLSSGGNLEATPEGHPYTLASTPPKFRNFLSRWSEVPPIFLDPVPHVALDHVDTYLTFIPAQNRCGYALMFADPLFGIALEGNDSLRKEAMMMARRPGLTKKPGEYLPEDFVPVSAALKTKLPEQMWEDLEVNLAIAKSIRASALRIKNSMQCLDDVFGVPQSFVYNGMAMGYVPEFQLANGIVLQNHYLVNAEGAPSAALDGIAQRLGGRDKIHSFEGTYGGSAGSHHCITQVIRDLRAK
jgi:hypothetical protein